MAAVLTSIPFLVGGTLTRLAPLGTLSRLRERDGVREAANRRLLKIACAILLTLVLLFAFREVWHPHPLDIGTTTLDAGRALAAGNNPYLLPLDPQPGFTGYKYLPMMALAYLPLGLPWGASGLVLTNLLLYLGLLWTLYRVLARRAGPDAALLGCFLTLSLPLIPFQLFAKGVTDLVAVLPLLVAFGLYDRKPGWAGFLVGLSLAAKPLPGALLLPCLVPATGKARLAYGLGIIIGLTPILPFAIASPRALFENTILFNGLRPPDSTNWTMLAPPFLQWLARLGAASFVLVTAIKVWRARPRPAARAALASALILATILAGPIAHHNYQLWWITFYVPLLALAITGTSAVPVAPASGDFRT